MAYRRHFRRDDFEIIRSAIEAIHDLQHAEGGHRINAYIERRIISEERLLEWMNDQERAESTLRQVGEVE